MKMRSKFPMHKLFYYLEGKVRVKPCAACGVEVKNAKGLIKHMKEHHLYDDDERKKIQESMKRFVRITTTLSFIFCFPENIILFVIAIVFILFGLLGWCFAKLSDFCYWIFYFF